MQMERQTTRYWATRQNASIQSAHGLFELDIGSRIPPVGDEVNVDVGTGNPVQPDQLTRSLWKGGGPEMCYDVANVSPIPKLLESLNEATVAAPVIKK